MVKSLYWGTLGPERWVVAPPPAHNPWGLMLPRSQACHPTNPRATFLRHELSCPHHFQPGPGGSERRWALGARNVAENWGSCKKDLGLPLLPQT